MVRKIPSQDVRSLQGGAEYVCNHLRSHQGPPTWRRPRSTRCRALVALGNRRTKQYEAMPSSSWSAGATKQRSPNVSSTASILTTGLSPPSSSAVGEAALKEVRAAEEALARLTSPQAITQITVGNKALNDKFVRRSGRLPEILDGP